MVLRLIAIKTFTAILVCVCAGIKHSLLSSKKWVSFARVASRNRHQCHRTAINRRQCHWTESPLTHCFGLTAMQMPSEPAATKTLNLMAKTLNPTLNQRMEPHGGPLWLFANLEYLPTYINKSIYAGAQPAHQQTTGIMWPGPVNLQALLVPLAESPCPFRVGAGERLGSKPTRAQASQSKSVTTACHGSSSIPRTLRAPLPVRPKS